MFKGEKITKLFRIVLRDNLETGGNFVYLGFGGFEDELVNVSAWGGGTGWAVISYNGA